MIDHVVLGVHQLGESKHFYENALAPLGILVVREEPEMIAFGDGGRTPFFWLALREPSSRLHIAFTASDRAAVNAFHAAALRFGGVDNGKPGLRLEYHEDYYAAYAYDNDGNNIEAVCHQPV